MKLFIVLSIAALGSFWGYLFFNDYVATDLLQKRGVGAVTGLNDTSLVTDDPLPVPTLGLTLQAADGSTVLEIQKKGTGSFIPYVSGQVVLAGDTVRTLPGESATLAIPDLGSIQLVDGASAGFINTLPGAFLIQYSGEIGVNGSSDAVISFRSLGVLVAFNSAIGRIVSDETDGVFVAVQSGEAEVGYLDQNGNPITHTVVAGSSALVNDGELITQL